MHILFAGGGTAGHINPALAVAEYIKNNQKDAKISYIGTAKKLEATLVPKAGYDFKTIDVAGFRRKISIPNLFYNISAASKAVTSSFAARKILKELKPDIVMGTGGYVSGPVLREAVKLGIKTAIHEQNAYPGITTKMLAPKVDRVMLAMPEAKKHLNIERDYVITGNPVREDFLKIDKSTARKNLNLDSRPVILSFGGSLGARAINESIIELIKENYNKGEFIFIHSTGAAGYDSFVTELTASGVNINAENIRILKYIDNMAECMAAADLVIGRAGAITLTELEAAGRASILIPSPYVAENHQFHNAMTLKENNAAEIIEEKDLNGEILINTVNKLLENNLTDDMGKNSKAMAITDASARIYDCIMQLLNSHN